MPDKPKVVIISGPSGVGKSTICTELVRKLEGLYRSVSVTTRQKSDTEEDGKDYWFVSKQQFRNMIDKAELLEYAEVFGNLYGTPKTAVDEALQDDKTVILEIDVQGAKQAKTIYPDAVMIFILPPTKKELAERMNLRGREENTVAEKRLSQADREIAAAWQYYEHMVINEDVDRAVSEVIRIIEQS